MTKYIAGNILTFFVSIVLACLAVEFGYRVYLNIISPSKISTSFAVIDKAPYRYDRVAGFDYGPNNTFTLTFMHDNTPHSFRFVSDANGNPGNAAKLNAEGKLPKQLFIYGDSFTFRHYEENGFQTWPQLMQTCSEMLQAGYKVTGFARDGMGVLQMFDFAAYHLQANGHRPDAIIIAFITDDLRRRRTWRKTVQQADGSTNVYTSYDPEFRFRPGEYFRTILVDPNADGTVTAKDTEKLHEISERFRQAARREDRVGVGLLSSNSYVVNKIVYKLFENKIRAQKHYIDIDNFADDEQFIQDVRMIKQSGIPVILVLLPQLEELQTGHHLFREQERSLLDSLVRITGAPLLDVMNCAPVPKSPEDLFCLPFDRHPNVQGLRYYADTLAKVLGQRRQELRLP